MTTLFTRPKLEIHFVLRYSDLLKERDTIAEHEKVLKRCGRVWMGKFGMGVSPALIEKTVAQIGDGVPTWVYLSHHKSITRRARLTHIVGGGSRAMIMVPCASSTPRYYSKQACSVWFELASIEKCSPAEIASLRLYNDPSVPPLFTSMRGLFYVTKETPDETSANATSGHRSRRIMHSPGVADYAIDSDFDDMVY